MRTSASKSEVIVLSQKKVDYPLRVGRESLLQVKEFKYLRVLFMSEEKMVRVASDVDTEAVKKELSQRATLSICWSIYPSTLTYGHELWVVTKRMRLRIQAAEMSFLPRVG